jgi:hypothetical protein
LKFDGTRGERIWRLKQLKSLLAKCLEIFEGLVQADSSKELLSRLTLMSFGIIPILIRK